MSAQTIIVRNNIHELVGSHLNTFFDLQYDAQQGHYEIVGIRCDALSTFAENVAKNVIPRLSEEELELFFYKLQAIYNSELKLEET